MLIRVITAICITLASSFTKCFAHITVHRSASACSSPTLPGHVFPAQGNANPTGPAGRTGGGLLDTGSQASDPRTLHLALSQEAAGGVTAQVPERWDQGCGPQAT